MHICNYTKHVCFSKQARTRVNLKLVEEEEKNHFTLQFYYKLVRWRRSVSKVKFWWWGRVGKGKYHPYYSILHVKNVLRGEMKHVVIKVHTTYTHIIWTFINILEGKVRYKLEFHIEFDLVLGVGTNGEMKHVEMPFSLRHDTLLFDCFQFLRIHCNCIAIIWILNDLHTHHRSESRKIP